MRTSSPFARSTVTVDDRARRLYMAIDGRKTVDELAAMTGLETKDVSKLLHMLLQDHCIELHDAAGQLVETTLGSALSWGNEAPSSLTKQRAERGSL